MSAEDYDTRGCAALMLAVFKKLSIASALKLAGVNVREEAKAR